MKNKANRL